MSAEMRTPGTEHAKDAQAQGGKLPLQYRMDKAAGGMEHADDLLAIEGLPITGMGSGEFQKNRDDLGRTHKKIAQRLAYKEGAYIIPDNEPLIFGGTLHDESS